MVNKLYLDAVSLLKNLISTPSFSKEEDKTAIVLTTHFKNKGINFKEVKNNVYAFNKYFESRKPTILLNSHHDTVKPNKGYTLDPFSPVEKDGKLFGLGSNDAGGCLVSLLQTFVHFYPQQNLKYNLVFAASAEEEISGSNGIELLLPHIGKIDFGIVGEPTQMEMAVAERGLIVMDCLAEGKAGHAARNEGENALYKALEDIERIKNLHFEKVSNLLGATRLTVTAIETENKQHNVVPAQCSFVIDGRVNELYTFDEVIAIVEKNISGKCIPRSTRLKSTAIPLDHPLIVAGIQLGKGYYGSPTTSDKALMNFPTLKMGPGDSARSHTADEFIYLREVEEGISTYIKLLELIV